MKYAVVIALILFLVFLGPFLALWSLNTLFPSLEIPYTLETWAAALILTGVVSAKVNK